MSTEEGPNAEDFAIDAPAALLAALDEGERKAPLEPEVETLVGRALAEGTWLSLVLASRVLRMLQREARKAGHTAPPRVAEALAQVRAAMRALVKRKAKP